MDDRHFDSLARALATGRDRRSLIKGMVGAGAGLLTAGALIDRQAEAARRGFSGPTFPTFTPCLRDGQGQCCASGVFEDVDRCCPIAYLDSGAKCCDPSTDGAWTGCCCPVSPAGQVIGECSC